MSNHIKPGNKLLVISQDKGETNSIILDVIDENNLTIDIDGQQYLAKLDNEGMWIVEETLDKVDESLLRDTSKKQLSDLNKMIKKSGGDIQDRVRKGEKRKENKMPNAYYMDNPFDARRKSIDTWEQFTKTDAHYKSIAMKSRDPQPNRPHTDSKLSKLKLNEEVMGSPLKTMNAHFQTHVLPKLSKSKQFLIKNLDVQLFKFNYNEDTNLQLSFRTPPKQGGNLQLTINNISKDHLNKVNELINNLGINGEFDGKSRLELNIYNDKRVNESKKQSKKDSIVVPKKLKNLKNFYQSCKDGDCKQKSDILDDSWVKGDKEDLLRPMFKNLPDATIRRPYDTLRAGKWVNLDGVDCRINSLDGDCVLVDIVDENNKPKTVKFKINDFLKKIKKSKK